MVILVPGDFDPCVRLAAGWIGIGTQNVIGVPAKEFKYDMQRLRETIKRVESEKVKIISLVCYAGRLFSSFSLLS